NNPNPAIGCCCPNQLVCHTQALNMSQYHPVIVMRFGKGPNFMATVGLEPFSTTDPIRAVSPGRAVFPGIL
ncbi:MAG: hypothetical protein O2890_14365, partial [Cyanobacteria bacterium]|nr:hypothetical protein [Cyanobacteriota bacterium]